MADNNGTSETIEPNTGQSKDHVQQEFPMKNDLLNIMLTSESSTAKEGLEKYCHRFTLGKINSQGPDTLVCSETFSVNTGICVMGIQVSSQIENDTSTYTEMLTVKLFDCDEQRLTKMDFKSEVNTGSLIKLLFEMPVYVKKNESYRVEVAFGKVGCYPLLPCRHRIFCDPVTFTYGSENSTARNRSDLIASIIYIPIVSESPKPQIRVTNLAFGSPFRR